MPPLATQTVQPIAVLPPFISAVIGGDGIFLRAFGPGLDAVAHREPFDGVHYTVVLAGSPDLLRAVEQALAGEHVADRVRGTRADWLISLQPDLRDGEVVQVHLLSYLLPKGSVPIERAMPPNEMADHQWLAEETIREGGLMIPADAVVSFTPRGYFATCQLPDTLARSLIRRHVGGSLRRLAFEEPAEWPAEQPRPSPPAWPSLALVP